MIDREIHPSGSSLWREVIRQGTYRPVLSYFILLFCGITILRYYGMIDRVPNGDTIMQWDTGWYTNVKVNGYQYFANKQSNVAFFPFFPYLWRYSGLGPAGIAILNASIFGLSFMLLAAHLRLSWNQSLLLLSIPSFFFFYVPYSESVFFAASTGFIIAHQRSKYLLAGAFIFLCSLMRPVAFFFIPAFLAAECYMLLSKRDEMEVSLKRLLLYGGASLMALSAVLAFQYWKTGVAFGFFKTETLYWDHHFRLPSPPLHTWGDGHVLWIDGLALWTCLSALLYLGVSGIGVLIRNNSGKEAEKSEGLSWTVIFSLSFLALTGLVSVFFRANLMSINRYCFCNPFFVVFVCHAVLQRKLLSKDLLISGSVAAIAVTLLLKLGHSAGDYTPPSWLFFLCFLVLIAMIGSLRYWRQNYVTVTYVLSYLLLSLQIALLYSFLKSVWIG